MERAQPVGRVGLPAELRSSRLARLRSAASLLKKGALSRCIGRIRGGLNSTLRAVCDADGKPLILLLAEGQVSDYRGAAAVLSVLPDADTLFGDQNHDSDCFRGALARRGITPCIPGRASRKKPVTYDACDYCFVAGLSQYFR